MRTLCNTTRSMHTAPTHERDRNQTLMAHSEWMAPRNPWRIHAAGIILFGLWAMPAAWAQRVASPSMDNLPGLPALEELALQIERTNSLPAEEKEALSAQIESAARFARQTAEHDAKAAHLREQAGLASHRVEQLRNETAVGNGEDEPVPADYAEIEAWVAHREAEWRRAQERKEAAEKDLEHLRGRASAIPAELEATERTLAALPPAGIVPPGDGSAASVAALLQGWEREAKAAQARLLRTELETMEPRLQIATAEQRAAAIPAERLRQALDAAQSKLGQLRMAQALQATRDVREVRRLLEQAPAPLREYAGFNVELAEALAVDAADTQELSRRLSQRQDELEELQHSLDRVTHILAVGDLPAMYSEQLRQERQKLTWIRPMEVDVRARQDQAAFKRIGQIETETGLHRLASIEAQVEHRRYGNVGLTEEDAATMRLLLETRRKLLEDRRRTLDEFHRVRSRVDRTEADLIRNGRAMRQMLDEHLIWTRNLPGIGLEWLRDQQLNAPRLASERTRYWGAGSDWLGLLWIQKYHLALGILILGLVARIRPRLRRRIAELATRTDRLLTDRFTFTVEALAWTVVLASIGPGILLWAGWLMLDSPGGELIQGLGFGAMNAAAVAWACGFLRCLCRPAGLAEVHFRWPAGACRTLNRAARFGIWIYVPLLTVTAACLWNGELWLRSGPARLAYAVLLALLAVQVRGLLHSEKGILREWPAEALPLLKRTIPALRTLLVGLLLVLLAGVLRGYFYTARVLMLRLSYLALVALGAVLAYNLALRWLRVARRRYAIAQIRQRRREAKSGDGEVQDEEGAGIQLKDLEPFDLEDLNDQTHRIIRLAVVVTTAVAFLGLLRPLLPALGVFDGIVLWQGAGGNPISVQNLLGALLAAFLATAAARNVPGLLEMLVLPHLPIRNSSRFAVVTLVRYVIVIAGILIVFGTIGISWSSVQWLAAAITVGLGFGLQEIFANFVSGIILLFEQPIRVGDIVTIDGTTGVVSRIQMRATTITDWDRKELVVPNKEFVTGRLLNWSLTDSVTRVQINVGVAYGSDVRRALEILLGVAAANERVLKDPKPIVAFEEFSTSTLNLSLRAFLPNLDNRLLTVTELNTSIAEAFQKAGIEIAFPQRDLHVRSIAPDALRQLGLAPDAPATGGSAKAEP